MCSCVCVCVCVCGQTHRSISGITSCEQKVLLQPNENYLFYIKAVNEAGASEQSEAALISTKGNRQHFVQNPLLYLYLAQIHFHIVSPGLFLFSGTRFHLLKDSAHPALELSVDQTTVHYSHNAPENILSTDRE